MKKAKTLQPRDNYIVVEKTTFVIVAYSCSGSAV